MATSPNTFPNGRLVDPLTEALRIDDLRSDYCAQLESRIAAQTAEIEFLRMLLRQGAQGSPGNGRNSAPGKPDGSELRG
jgi:hypothetical protein